MGNTKGKSQIKLAFFALSLLTGLMLAGKLLAFAYSLNQPISPEIKQVRTSKLNSQMAINLLVGNISFHQGKVCVCSKDQKTPGINLVSFYPKGDKIIVLKLSDDLYVDVPKGYGRWQIGSVYSLGQEEQKSKKGALLLGLSVSKLIGLPIDGVILFKDGKNIQSIEEFTQGMKNNFFAPFTLSSSIESSLTPLEVAGIFKELSSVRRDKIKIMDLAKSTITDSKLLPDSSRVLGVDTIKLDSYIRDKMSDFNILEEGVSVAVFNATDYPGLAQEASRVITNMGGNVVVTTSTDKRLEKTAIYQQNNEKNNRSLTYKRLAEIFAPGCLSNPCTTDDKKVLHSRSKINIVLGEDYYNFWHKR